MAGNYPPTYLSIYPSLGVYDVPLFMNWHLLPIRILDIIGTFYQLELLIIGTMPWLAFFIIGILCLIGIINYWHFTFIRKIINLHFILIRILALFALYINWPFIPIGIFYQFAFYFPDTPKYHSNLKNSTRPSQ